MNVQLLSFNDYHGHLAKPTSSDGTVTSGTVVTPAGGAAYLAAKLAELRSGHDNSFTVAAGDLIGGSTFDLGHLPGRAGRRDARRP